MRIKDDFGFPDKTRFLPIFWEKESFFEAKDLFNQYLCEPKLTRIYHNGIYYGNGGALEEIIVYEQILIDLLVNHFDKITLTLTDIKNVIENFIEYIRNEQVCLNNDFLDTKEIITRTIYHVNSTIILLVSYIYYTSNNHDTNLINKPIEEYSQLIKPMQDIYGVDLVINFKNTNDIFKIVKKKLYSGEQGNILASTRIILSILLFYEDKNEICDYIQDIFDSLEYADVCISNKVISSMSLITTSQIYITTHNQNKFVNILLNCINRSYKVYTEKRKENFDLLYTISNLTRNYYDSLIKNDIPLSKELSELIEKFKSSKLNEIKNKWYNL